MAELSALPEVLAAWKNLLPEIEALGVEVIIRSSQRTCAQQAEQYAIGRLPNDTRAVVTHAKGCVSWHVHGRAIDVTLKRGGKPAPLADYQAMGALAKARGWVWGGAWKDDGHVEYHPGLKIEQVCPNPDDCHNCAGCVTMAEYEASNAGSEKSASGWGWVALGVVALVGTYVGIRTYRSRT